MTATCRFGSLLMILLLGVPLVRDCCLPIAHSLPCHESKQSVDAACSALLQAIAEPKTTIGGNSSFDYVVPDENATQSAIIVQVQSSLDHATFAPRLIADIYLRTHALLI